VTLGAALALAGVGFAAGVVNTLAGGGSFVSLAVLLWLGVPAPVANGSNRVAVLVQSLAAWATFRGEAAVSGAEAAVTVAGALAGASLAVGVPAAALERALALAMLALAAFALARPASFAAPGPPSPWRWPGLFLVAAYGGFAQAGIGLLLVPLLVRTTGVDAVRANAKKVVLVSLVSLPSLLAFLAAGQVDGAVGGALAAGALLGGIAGARLTERLGSIWVWRVLLAMTALTALRAFWPG
jgi:uncharacterized membrane protein YfcA